MYISWPHSCSCLNSFRCVCVWLVFSDTKPLGISTRTFDAWADCYGYVRNCLDICHQVSWVIKAKENRAPSSLTPRVEKNISERPAALVESFFEGKINIDKPSPFEMKFYYLWSNKNCIENYAQSLSIVASLSMLWITQGAHGNWSVATPWGPPLRVIKQRVVLVDLFGKNGGLRAFFLTK